MGVFAIGERGAIPAVLSYGLAVRRRSGSPSSILSRPIVRPESEMICKHGEKKTVLRDSQFALAQSTAGHDAWFRAKVKEALDDLRGGIPHAKVKAQFAKRRSFALRKARNIGNSGSERLGGFDPTSQNRARCGVPG